MKKILFISMLLILCISNAAAQKTAEIKFDKQTYNFGKFSESNPVQKCTFNFTNVGDAPLVINQAMASCGCTVPSYTKAPIAPGGKGTVTVTYNGKGKFPGHFKKSITIKSNAKNENCALICRRHNGRSKINKKGALSSLFYYHYIIRIFITNLIHIKTNMQNLLRHIL